MDKIRYSEEDEADTQGLISEASVRRSHASGCRPFWVVALPWVLAVISICSSLYLDYQLRVQQRRYVPDPYSKWESPSSAHPVGRPVANDPSVS